MFSPNFSIVLEVYFILFFYLVAEPDYRPQPCNYPQGSTTVWPESGACKCKVNKMCLLSSASSSDDIMESFLNCHAFFQPSHEPSVRWLLERD